MSARVVLDASAALHLVLRTDAACHLSGHLVDAVVVLAPSLYAVDVANGLWKYVRAGELERDAALECLDEALALVDLQQSDAALVAECLTEAARTRHPVHDLVYVVLARRNGCAVVTTDRRLAGLLERLGVPALGAGRRTRRAASRCQA